MQQTINSRQLRPGARGDWLYCSGESLSSCKCGDKAVAWQFIIGQQVTQFYSMHKCSWLCPLSPGSSGTPRVTAEADVSLSVRQHKNIVPAWPLRVMTLRHGEFSQSAAQISVSQRLLKLLTDNRTGLRNVVFKCDYHPAARAIDHQSAGQSFPLTGN